MRVIKLRRKRWKRQVTRTGQIRCVYNLDGKRKERDHTEDLIIGGRII
jgi:hypothetical protein